MAYQILPGSCGWLITATIRRLPYSTPSPTFLHSSPADGYRVLVDRVWPRGVSKANAAVDEWAKDVAPSTELRKWFNHDAAKWKRFQQKYRAELKERCAELRGLLERSGAGAITLVFSAKDTEHNQAVVLKDALVGTSLHSAARRAG